MLLEFIKRSWLPYLGSVVVYSLILAIAFSFVERLGFNDVIFLYTVILAVSGINILVIAMPFVFLMWRNHQKLRVRVSHWRAGISGLLCGLVINFVFMAAMGGWLMLPQLLLVSLFAGGGYGATFATLFSVTGGLELKQSELTGASGRVAHSA